MRKKKKDELEPGFETPSEKSEPVQPTSNKFTGQPVVQTSNKPVVGFNELKIKSQFLLQDTAQQNNTVEVKQNQTSASADNSVDEELTEQRVLDGVKQFAEEKAKAGSRQLYATLTSSKISLQGTTILIELHNESQREMLTNIKQDMLDEFRVLLKNKQAQLEIKVSEIQGEVKAYKPSDKFKQMAEKNPALLELKKRFDLDIEY